MADVDFGRDTSCTDSLRTGRFSSGVQLVGEACYRRLITPHGTLQGGEAEQDYGLDLAGKIGSAVTPALVAALPGQITSELLKDERLESVTVDVSSTTAPSGAVSWTVTVEGTTSLGPFTLVIGVSGVTVELLGLQVETT